MKAKITKKAEVGYKRIVEKGGGVYAGVQECEGWRYDLVLFNAPSGSTLALKTNELTPEKVSTRIKDHQEAWKRSAKQ